MSDVVIRAEGLGKKYLIGHQHQRERYTALRDVVSKTMKTFGQSARDIIKGRQIIGGNEIEEFWALKDVNFEIMRGEVVGIIGRNGAGKSTLLKILSRITEPSEGRVEIKGRLASLLEVGTGFHPELTGRENIFLNGAILGMSRAEIKRKFDEIVAFAEVEKFLDTPVKRYSSGMYVRLAFSVAAHLEPDILVVDEVLAVGDAEFQKKCIQKMNTVSSEGRTILLVSHNMGVVANLASRGVWLANGRKNFDGGVRLAIENYVASGYTDNNTMISLSDHVNRLPGMSRILRTISLQNSADAPQRDFLQSDSIVIKIEYEASNGTALAGAGFIFRTIDGIRVGGFNTYMAAPPPHRIPTRGAISFELPARQITPGNYLLTVSIGSHQGVLVDKVEDCIAFSVAQSDIYGTGYLLTKEDGVAALTSSCRILTLEKEPFA